MWREKNAVMMYQSLDLLQDKKSWSDFNACLESFCSTVFAFHILKHFIIYFFYKLINLLFFCSNHVISLVKVNLTMFNKNHYI